MSGSSVTVPGVALTPDELREARRRAARVPAAIEDRNRFIVELAARGRSNREIAKAFGLTHPAVADIVRKSKAE